MVGWLIEEDQVGLLQKNLGQLDPHSPSSGKLGGVALKIIPDEAQAQKDFFHFGFVVDFLDGVKELAKFRYLLDQFVVFVRFVVGTDGQFFVDSVDFGFHPQIRSESLGSLLHHGAVIRSQQMLWQISYHKSFWRRNSSRTRLVLTRNDLEQSGFPCPVFPHEGDLVGFVDVECNVTEKRAAAVDYGDVID